MSKGFFILLVLSLGFNGAVLSSAQTLKPGTVAFNWAFIYKQKEGMLKSLDEQQPVTRLAAGDRIKFFLQPIQNAYIYLYLYDSEKKLLLLFPGHKPKRFFEAEYRQATGYYVPADRIWLSVNEGQGQEVFYLLVAKQRLSQLEALTDAYLELDSAGTPAAETLNKSKQAVLDEIRHVKNQHSIFQGLVEKPIIIAGDYRGGNDIQSFVKGVEVENFYAKTIRLAH